MTKQDCTTSKVTFIEEPTAQLFEDFSVPEFAKGNIVYNELKKVEMIARVCYRSEASAMDLSDEDSLKKTAKFISMLLNRKHYAMFEHSVFHFKMRIKYTNVYYQIRDFFNNSHYCYVDSIYDEEHYLCVTTNLRFILESTYSLATHCLKDEIWKELSKVVKDSSFYSLFNAFFAQDDKSPYGVSAELCIPTEQEYNSGLFEKYYTFCFTTDRGVTHELVRHRVASYAQESTRYCIYNKDITFMIPAQFDTFPENMKKAWKDFMVKCAQEYRELIDSGVTPQNARSVLPNSLATKIVMTVSEEELKHVLCLRYEGTTGAPHPDMKALMKKVKEVL